MEIVSTLQSKLDVLTTWSTSLSKLDEQELIPHKYKLKMEFRRMLKLKPEMDSCSDKTITCSFEKLLLKVRSLRDLAMGRKPPNLLVNNLKPEGHGPGPEQEQEQGKKICKFGGDCTSLEPEHFFHFLHLNHPKANKMIAVYQAELKRLKKANNCDSDSDSDDCDYDENEAKKQFKKRQTRQKKIDHERLQSESMMDELELNKLRKQRLDKLLKKTDRYMKTLTARIRRNYKDKAENDTTSTSTSTSTTPALNDVGTFFAGNNCQESIEQTKSLCFGKLKDYQKVGLKWMVSLYQMRLNGILADEMGLGKTVQVMGLIAYIMDIYQIRGKYLVVCPLSTLSGWKDHFATWLSGLKIYIHKGSASERREKIIGINIDKYDYNVVLSTYERVILDAEYLSTIKWHYLIIDEAHRIKNKSSKLFTCLNSFSTRSRLLLTGTPLQNSLTELWSLLNFILPEIFDSVLSFESWFCAGTGTGTGTAIGGLTDEERLLVVNRLHRAIDPFLLRRVKKDVLPEMTECKEVVIKCQMSGMQNAIYNQLRDYKALMYKGEKRRTTFNNLLIQFRKCAVHPYMFQKQLYDVTSDIYRCSGKLHFLHQLIPKMKQFGHRMLIFCQFVLTMDIISEYLEFVDEDYLRIDGSTPAEERFSILEQFNQLSVFVFLLSTRACGTGLNLFVSDTVILFESDWNPQQDQQAMARVHRIGQTKDVRVFRLITSSTVDEVIYERAQKKIDLERKAIEGGKFDFSLSSAERKQFLQNLLNKKNENSCENYNSQYDSGYHHVHLNKMIARSEEEINQFNKIDQGQGETNQKCKLAKQLSSLIVKPELPDWLEPITTTKDLENVPTKRIRKKVNYNFDAEWNRIEQIIENEKKETSDTENENTNCTLKNHTRSRKRKRKFNDISSAPNDQTETSLEQKKRKINS